MSVGAIVAQLVEQLIRNEQVTGSIPANGSIFYDYAIMIIENRIIWNTL